MTESKSLSFAVLLGSVRQERMGIRAARMAVNALEARGHEAVLVDPMVVRLPLLDRMYKEYASGEAPEVLETLATLYRRVDAFVIVTAEYNHGIPPALKNLLDHFLEEYFWRPSGIVSYSAGQFGGVRAAFALRETVAELGMPSISSTCPVPRIGHALDEQGVPTDERLSRSLGRFLDELEWYARALKRQRAEGTPY
ncbi:NAD(P)H-dependent FMN reductase [Luteibacter rhizovicinus]|uniref:NAD(P)H-dependent FMN reductase n=1 Tax=Luteibacter rhizovicinus TaxID=242606 RepID=A0A4R3YQ69_9GAMM|nr:NAD(P)H-dependent oxidoreductase [Luteibacter rhizovicinus]TCV94531.1 NAD(P)H-dependent FMN reductase [Luteibacter rhizovicinus]